MNGVWCDTPEAVTEAFVKYYEALLGTNKGSRVKVNLEIVAKGVVLTESQVQRLNYPFSRADVKSVIFSIPDEKALGPDGYSSTFFKKAWEVIGDDVTDVVLQFIENGRLLKELDCTTLTLIRKVD